MGEVIYVNFPLASAILDRRKAIHAFYEATNKGANKKELAVLKKACKAADNRLTELQNRSSKKESSNIDS